MQWLTMSMPTPRTMPEPGGELDLGADAVGRGDEHRVVHRQRSPWPRRRRRSCRRRARTSAPWVRSTAAFIWATARLPSSMSTPAAAYDVERRRPAPASRCRGGPACRRSGRRPSPSYAAARAAARSAPSPVTASTRPPVVPPSAIPAGNRIATVLESRRRSAGRGSSEPASPMPGRPGSRRRRRRRCRRRRRAISSGDRGEVAPRARPGRASARSEREQRQHGLRLGVAEAAVVLDQARAVGGQHQPGVEHADVRRAGGGEVVERPAARTSPRSSSASYGDRRRRVGAHPAGVRAGVALADALVVLGERQGARRCGRRTARAASTPGPSSAPRARTGRRAVARIAALGLGVVGGHGDALAGRPARRA